MLLSVKKTKTIKKYKKEIVNTAKFQIHMILSKFISSSIQSALIE